MRDSEDKDDEWDFEPFVLATGYDDVFKLSPYIADRLADPDCSDSERRKLEFELRWIQESFVDPPEKLSDIYRDVFEKFHFDLIPSSGFIALALEISVVLHMLHGEIPNKNFIPSKTASFGKALAGRLSSVKGDLFLFLNNSGEFLHFANGGEEFEAHNVTTEEIAALDSISRKLALMSEAIQRQERPKKWAASELRMLRIRLAGEVSSLFEHEFGQAAKPLGGSASRNLQDENNWVRFYQSIAYLLLDESATPDRQAVLWEGYKLFKNGKKAG